MKISQREIRSALEEVERIRGKLGNLYFKMEEGEGDEGADDLNSYITAKDAVSDAQDRLLDAVDALRRHL